MIGIIVAMREELDVLLPMMDCMEEIVIQRTMFIKGHLNGKSIVVVKCQVGKVNATISTMLLLSRFTVSAIINIGTAGGLGSNVNILDVVLAEHSKQYDTNFEFHGQPSFFSSDSHLLTYGENTVDLLQNIKIHKGLIVSGDLFVSTDVSAKITEKYPMALCCDMETAAVANVCYRMEIPFLAIRAVSDIPAEGNRQFVFNWKAIQATDRCVQVLTAILAQMDANA